MNDKVIITNLSAFKRKYGSRYSAISEAIKKLIAADKKRGINTKLIALDNAAEMKKLKAPVVTNAANPRQNKRAIDGVFKELRPEFMMILGSTDIIPHQDMNNPVYDGDNDPDEFAYGDLPYACEAAYSQRPEDFIGPTRVVGRLPDITGTNDPTYLVGLLETAANAKSLTSSDYSSYHGISAKVWEKSTRLSMERLFGSGRDVRLSPVEGPNWESQLLGRRMHFVNCHGAPADPNFYGQSGSNYPTAHSARLVAGQISEGTVAAAECCYGAELYDPSVLNSGQAGICNTYLASKAYGYFGSTTIAYGPAEGNGAADLICQFFLRRVLAGASLGRAALEARQQFATQAPELDPTDLKTLVQFNLLGDPSLYPVVVETPQHAVARTPAEKGIPPFALSLTVDRASRRQQLMSRGLWIAKNQPVARRVDEPTKTAKAHTRGLKASKARAAHADRSTLKMLISDAGLESATTQSYIVAPKAAPKPKASTTKAAAKAPPPVRMHVVLGKRAENEAGLNAVTPDGVTRTIALIAKEVNGKILSYRELYGK
jgi:hypothetical protein